MNTKKLSTMLLVTVATLGIGMGSAFAQTSPGGSGYIYPDFWGNEASQSASQSPAVTQSNGDSVATYATQSRHDGTWLFPPDPNGGGNS
jgi:hypothetical protein